MMKFLVISDTHGCDLSNLEKEALKYDRIVHLGDGLSDLSVLKDCQSSNILQIKGNTDGNSDAPTLETLQVEGLKILFCHGHLFAVKYNTDRLKAFAKARNADVVFYGHTHQQRWEMEGELLVFGVECYLKGCLRVCVDGKKLTVENVKNV